MIASLLDRGQEAVPKNIRNPVRKPTVTLHTHPNMEQTPMPTNSLAELLNTGNLGRLAAESRRLQDLADSVRRRLPAQEAEHLVAANTDEEGWLVLVMDAPVWAARVRYMARELGEDRIKVRVLPRGAASP